MAYHNTGTRKSVKHKGGGMKKPYRSSMASYKKKKRPFSTK